MQVARHVDWIKEAIKDVPEAIEEDPVEKENKTLVDPINMVPQKLLEILKERDQLEKVFKQN